MKVIKARFDGKVLVPDEPLDLPVNCAVEAVVRRVGPATDKPLLDLLNGLNDTPVDDQWPADGAMQHDYYLYGAEKRK